MITHASRNRKSLRRRKPLKKLPLSLVLLLLTACNRQTPPTIADELKTDGKNEKAIEVLKQHIADRLEDKKRPEWENPYFYELEIGDIYLSQDKYLDAHGHYEIAEKMKVEKSLVSDRYRALAEKLRQAQKYDDAINILKQHRDLDPLLFDAAMDQIAKEAVKAGQ